MTTALVVFACVIGALSITAVSNATVGVGGIAFACLLAILARLAQARDQHVRLLQAITNKSTSAILVLTLGCSPAFAQDKIAVAVFSSAAITDWVTTHQNLTTPSVISADGTMRTELYEANPLIGWASDTPALMFAVAAGLDAAGMYGWYRLTKNHTKIRTIGIYAAAAARFSLAYKNTRDRQNFLKATAPGVR